MLFPGILGILPFPVIFQKLLDIDHEFPGVIYSDIDDIGDRPVDSTEKDSGILE